MATPPLSAPQLDALRELHNKRETLDSEHRALVEELYKQHLSTPAAKPKSTLEEFGDMAKTAALPMLGQAAFGMAGAPAGPAGIVAGEMTGALIGTKANELLGISKPDELDYALSGGAPLVGAGLGRLYRRLIPGAAAAEQQIGAERLRSMVNIMEGEGRDAVNKAYALVGQTPLKVSNFATKVDELAMTEQNLKGYGEQVPRLTRTLAKTGERIGEQGGQIPLTDANALLKRYRERADSLEGHGGEQWGAYKALRGSLLKDLRLAAESGRGTEAALLRQAMLTAKKQIATEELSEMIAKHGVKMETVGTATFETIDPTKVLNKLRGMDFAETVGPKLWPKIEQTLKQLAKIPHPSDQLKTGIGSEGRAIAMAGGAGVLGGATALSMGAGATEALSGGTGTALAAYSAIKVHDAVANLFMGDAGRNFLVKLFKHNGGRLGLRTAEVLQFAATQFQDTGDTTPQRERQASNLVGLATNPDVGAERRLRLGIPRPAGPALQQP